MPMDLGPRRPTKRANNDNVQGYFRKQENPPKKLEYPEEMMIERHSQDELLHWKAPEYEFYEKSPRWYLAATIILATICIYALVKNSPITAIVFVLIGVVGYLYLQKEPRILDFRITDDGVIAGKEIYEFESIKSFWIFYDPPYEKILSLHMKAKFLPYIHIPIQDEDPVKIREALTEFIPEVKQEKTLVDIVERVLHL